MPGSDAKTATSSPQKNLPASRRHAAMVPAIVSPAVHDAHVATAPLTVYETMDKSAHAILAKATSGLAPTVLAEAWIDWATHFATSPGKQLKLVEKALRKLQRLSSFSTTALGTPDPCIKPLPQDKRFEGEAWQKWPYNLMYQSFLLNQQWWHNVMTDVPGVTPQHEKVLDFTVRQMLDMFSPKNGILTNPEVLQATITQGGMNLVRGAANFREDLARQVNHGKPAGAEDFVLGRDLATSPGKVVFRNRLIELIQYAPTTDKVRPEPILIVPAWIMKYYILDLSRNNSLVSYLTGQGFTVFMISWKNPDEGDRDLGMEDYRNLGIMDALEVVQSVTGSDRVHGVGYCLGGTLLAIAAAAMDRDGDNRFGSLTFLAAQTDFTEAGELTLFISEAQISMLEDMMWEKGYLTADQMSGAFQLLRSNDLIWSRDVHDYLMGEKGEMFDLLAWNSDTTRMPYRMHSEYLRRLFLNNDLAEGRYQIDGRAIAVSDLRAPIFAVGTEQDHVAPWHSVYKIHLFADSDVSFVLTSGGHNAGIVSEPGHAHRHFRIKTTRADAAYQDPDSWLADSAVRDGSWWPELARWLSAQSGALTAPPPMGVEGQAPLGDAPGTYVMQA